MEAWETRRKRLEDEMQAHIDLEAQENVEAGMAPLEARPAAMKKFGSVSLASDQSREAWGWVLPRRPWPDARLPLPTLGQNGRLTLVALLPLLLGISASIAVFTR